MNARETGIEILNSQLRDVEAKIAASSDAGPLYLALRHARTEALKLRPEDETALQWLLELDRQLGSWQELFAQHYARMPNMDFDAGKALAERYAALQRELVQIMNGAD